jgi:phosphoglycolate phosphatase
MKYRHIIWDWNGTLWDDAWLCVEINNNMLGRRLKPAIDCRIYQDNLRFPVCDYYETIGFDYSEEPYEFLAEEFIAEYTERRFECDLQANARELIEKLLSMKIPQAVLSAYQHDTLLQAVDYFDLNPYFDAVIGLNDIYAAGKVENGIKYMAGLGLPPNEVLFIGDTVHDFDVATAMGTDCVLVDGGHNSRSRLEACGVPVFSDLSEVGGHILAHV